MKIGHPGVEIGEYELTDDPNCITGYIQPACEQPQWILYFTNRGEALFTQKREASGAVIGDPLKVKPSCLKEVRPKKLPPHDLRA